MTRGWIADDRIFRDFVPVKENNDNVKQKQRYLQLLTFPENMFPVWLHKQFPLSIYCLSLFPLSLSLFQII